MEARGPHRALEDGGLMMASYKAHRKFLRKEELGSSREKKAKY